MGKLVEWGKGFFNLRGLGIAGAVGLAVGFTGGMTLQGALKDGRIAKMEKADAEQRTADAKAALAEGKRLGALGQRVVTAYVERVGEVRWRTRTLVERVGVEVPDDRTRRLITGGDVVPLGALGLLDAAATGVSPSAVTAGLTPERADPVTFTQLTANVVDNYGIAWGWRGQLDALREWEEGASKVP